ncbi:hypothetical protein H0H92_011837 [Tricholoma furcatifolium]|nr:hypothetical protein H0H92_011837 [Tricholoma furcatifolium]
MFHLVNGKHTGERIANAVAHLLEHASYFTADNASNNVTFDTSFTAKYCTALTDKPKEALIPCFPHIINLCSQAAIKAANIPDSNDSDGEDTADENDPQNSTHHPKMLLAKIRRIISFICNSGQCIEAFEHLIRMGNTSGSWTEEDRHGNNVTIELKVLKLLLDVTTRWDSCYEMLLRFFYYEQVFITIWTRHHTVFKDMKHLALAEGEWDCIQQLITILKYPHAVQMVMANQKLPVLAMGIPAFEQFMTSWESAAAKHPELVAPIKAGLAMAYKYYSRFNETDTYIVAMFIYPGYKFHYIEGEWEDRYIKAAKKKIKNIMRQYCQKHETLFQQSAAQHPASPQKNHKYASGRSGRRRNRYDSDSNSSESFQGLAARLDVISIDEEYNMWVKRGLETEDIDLLAFWEKLTPLSPLLMEALQMTKYMIQQEGMDFTEGILISDKDLEILNRTGNDEDLLALLTIYSDRENAIDAIIHATDTDIEDDNVECKDIIYTQSHFITFTSTATGNEGDPCMGLFCSKFPFQPCDRTDKKSSHRKAFSGFVQTNCRSWEVVDSIALITGSPLDLVGYNVEVNNTFVPVNLLQLALQTMMNVLNYLRKVQKIDIAKLAETFTVEKVKEMLSNIQHCQVLFQEGFRITEGGGLHQARTWICHYTVPFHSKLSRKIKLVYTILVELLAYQFASPVLPPLRVQDMATRTLKAKYETSNDSAGRTRTTPLADTAEPIANMPAAVAPVPVAVAAPAAGPVNCYVLQICSPQGSGCTQGCHDASCRNSRYRPNSIASPFKKPGDTYIDGIQPCFDPLKTILE